LRPGNRIRSGYSLK